MTTIARKAVDSFAIRLATAEDAEAICAIYTPYVLETAITFDTLAPTVEEMREKIERVEQRYPFLVAEYNGEVVGFCYASIFRPRAAYVHAIETSVYLEKNCKGYGIGRALYASLENILRLQHVYTANACISFVDPADEFSPDTSRKFHERMGYTLCGHVPNCGRKFDRWYGVIWMQKELLPITDSPEPFVPFSHLDLTDIQAALSLAI